MTLVSYAHSELARVPQYNHLHEPIFKILKAISEEGHSGGSMGVFSGMLVHWAQDPKELEGNSLFEPIWTIVKDIDKDTRSIILELVGKLMTFTPLTDLTGEDSEWYILDYDESMAAQNNRMSNIFKRSDGSVYWSDAVVRYVPTETYSDFIGFTGGFSRKNITFPFDPNTEPVREYFQDDEYLIPLPDGVDPRAWLDEKRELFLSGHDPLTGKIFNDAFFFNSNEEIQEFHKLLQAFLIATSGMDDEALGYVISDLVYFHPRNKYFSTKIETNDLKLLNYVSEINSSMAIAKRDEFIKGRNTNFVNSFSLDENTGESTYVETIDLGPTEDYVQKGGITITTNSYAMVRNLIRVITRDEIKRVRSLFQSGEIGYSSLISFEYTVLNVYNPDKHYQNWIDTGKLMYSVIRSVPESTGLFGTNSGVHVDDGEIVGFLYNRYLYNKCKELGLEYKGSR